MCHPIFNRIYFIRYNSIFSSPLVQNPPTPISFFSLGSLLDWSRRWVPGKRVQGLLWHGNWWRRLDASLELYICRLQQFRESFERNHTKTKLGSGPERECSHLDNSSVEWNRLQRHKLHAVETTWQTGPHQEQHKQLVDLPSGKWKLGWLAGRERQLSDCQIRDRHV